HILAYVLYLVSAMEIKLSDREGVISLDNFLDFDGYNSSLSFVSLSSKQNIDLDGDLIRFSTAKSDLDFKMLEKLLKYGGENSLLYMKNSTIVPNTDASTDNIIAFQEVEIIESQDTKKGYLVPITPCLKYEGTGLGSVAFEYSFKTNFANSFHNGASETIPYFPLAVHAHFSFSWRVGASLVGTFTCNAKEGNNARLFATLALFEFNVRVKDHYFKKADHTLKSSGWNLKAPIKGLVTLQPSFYCGSSEKMDLMCSDPEEVLEEGKLPKYVVTEVGKSAAFLEST
ncbi:uncharacterized protein KQ657_002894, partial [Scheffersomyces spartinae]